MDFYMRWVMQHNKDRQHIYIEHHKTHTQSSGLILVVTNFRMRIPQCTVLLARGGVEVYWGELVGRILRSHQFLLNTGTHNLMLPLPLYCLSFPKPINSPLVCRSQFVCLSPNS